MTHHHTLAPLARSSAGIWDEAQIARIADEMPGIARARAHASERVPCSQVIRAFPNAVQAAMIDLRRASAPSVPAILAAQWLRAAAERVACHLDTFASLTFTKVPEAAEMVNHPAHYNQHPAGVECIDFIESMTGNGCNAVKYLWRAGLKPGESSVRDLKKAHWYIEREINRLMDAVTSNTYKLVSVADASEMAFGGFPGDGPSDDDE